MDPKSQPGTSQAVRLLSKDTASEGFDLAAGETWIYPTNYPTREYQFNIIQKALLKNTLVSLPTGLGKTFIAAVVMYNFYRWYPEGKLVFMAPTKPLVKQQVDACYNIMAIPLEVTAELTGAKQSAARTDVWTEKRVFFITPQVLQNDLNRIEQLGSKIKCLVFDEAHKARGNHAYCEVIQRLLAQGHKHFRVLALSATPGNSVNDVLEVVKNLVISHLEFRTEESIDVQPYVFQRTLETVVVPLSDKLIEVREKYLDILEYYTKNLKNYKIVQGNCGSLTKGKIFMLMKEFQARNRGTGSGHYAEIMRSLNICVTLYHAFELLIRHGLRNFLSFFEEHMEKPLLRGNHHLRAIVDDVRQFLGPVPDIEKLPDGTYPEVPTSIKFGHPKYYKLRDILVNHFQTSDQNTRVIVFFEYRESVMEAHLLLLQSRPVIQPRIFLGQGSGITQKVQIGVVKSFREGKSNVLLSTCIGEEGLDVGEVDLIVCFDISTKSPIRMVQRMGRTGRKRAGKVLVLVTEGKEQQTLKDCLIQKNNISSFVLGSKQLSSGMYPESPRLVPENISPKCEKIYITVKKKPLVLKKNGSIKEMLGSMCSGSNELIFSQELVLTDKPERIKMVGSSLFNKTSGTIESTFIEKSIFSKHLEKQRKSLKIYKIKHSKQSETLVKLLQISDSKRFNLPAQVQNTQANTKVLKQGDIRNMFLTTKSQDSFETAKSSINTDISTQELVKNFEKNDDVEIQNEGFTGTKELFAQISNFIFLKTTNNEKDECRHCPNNFSCTDFKITLGKSDFLNNNYLIPSDMIFEGITADDIESFTKSLDPKSEEDIEMEDDFVFDNIDFTQLQKTRNQGNKEINEKSFRFQAPDTLCDILDKFGDSILAKTQLTQQQKSKVETFVKNSDTKNIPRPISDIELFEFFKIDNLNTIFEPNSVTNSSQETIAYSPDLTEYKNISPEVPTPEESKQLSPLLDESFIIEGHESPILSSDDRVKMLRRKVLQRSKRCELKKDLFNTSQHDMQNVCGIPENDIYRSVSLDSATLSQERAVKRKDKSAEKKELLEISDICDLSDFLGTKSVKSKDERNKSNQIKLVNEKTDDYRSKIIPLNELIDESLFGLLTPPLANNGETEILNKTQKDKSAFSKNDETDIFGDLIDDSMIMLLTQTNDFKTIEGRNKSNESATHEMEKEKDPLFGLLSEPLNRFSEIDRKSTQQLQSIRSEDQNGLKHFENSKLLAKTSPIKISNKKSNKSSSEDFDTLAGTNKNFLNSKTENINMKTKQTDNMSNFANKGSFFESTPIRKPQNETFTQKVAKDEKRSSSDEFVEEALKVLDNNDNKKLDRNIAHKKINQNPQQSQQKGFHFKDTWFATTGQTNSKTIQIPQLNKEETNNKSDDKCIDLTLDSPPKSTPVKTQSNLTQINITQMLSLINKTQNSDKKLPANPFGSQITQKQTQANINPKPSFPYSQCKEPLMISTQKVSTDFSQSVGSSFDFVNGDFSDLKDFNETQKGSSQKENQKNKPNTINSRSDNSGNLKECSFTSSGWKTKARKNLLSTKRKCLLNNSEDSFLPVRKPATKTKLDPYGFITQSVTSSAQVNEQNQSKSGGSTTENFSSSDDEFDVKPKKSPVFIKPKSTNVPKTPKMRTESKKKKVKNKENPFLDVEAELSEDDNIFVSSDEDEGNSDYLEDSFVVPNATQEIDTQMHAHYLKSVRSPVIVGGRFKIPHRPTHNISNVFSQPVNQEENTYLEDSFCVDKEESQLPHELSELEILEMKLKNKKKKRKKSQENEMTSKLKRRRIIVINSDSD